MLIKMLCFGERFFGKGVAEMKWSQVVMSKPSAVLLAMASLGGDLCVQCDFAGILEKLRGALFLLQINAVLLGAPGFVEKCWGACPTPNSSEQFQKVSKIVKITASFNWPN